MLQTILSNLSSVFVFAIFLSILIVVHEWGHFITAKKLGVKVERFSLGFGPKLFSWMHYGTEFLLCLIPLGGYVKMAGDERSECKGKDYEFLSKPPGHRALIVLNGPVVNFILAYVSLFVVFMIGYPDLSTKVGKLMDGYPAQQAGLVLGDQILRINTQSVDSWTDIQNFIAQSQGDKITVTVLREGQKLDKVIVPKVEKLENVFGQKKERRIVGIQPTEDIITLKYDPMTAFVKATRKLWEITSITYKSLYFMLTGTISPKESMTGPIGIFFIVKTAAEMGFSHLLYILGVISASLAIFNLLPVIPLDGGHLFFLGLEKLRGKTISPKVDEWIVKIGVSLIVCLAIFVFYNDFSRFGWIDKVKHLIP